MHEAMPKAVKNLIRLYIFAEYLIQFMIAIKHGPIINITNVHFISMPNPVKIPNNAVMTGLLKLSEYIRKHIVMMMNGASIMSIKNAQY